LASQRFPATSSNVIDSDYFIEDVYRIILEAFWTTVSPSPGILNGQYTVTNHISGAQQFYRLSQ